MLVSFSVENVSSFRDQVTLDMRATSADATIKENTMCLPCKNKDIDLLKSAVIFGPNASGKSNLLTSLRDFLFFVCVGPRKKIGTKEIHKPFLLDPDTCNRPSRYEITLLIDGVLYRYGFSVDKDAVLEEWLFAASVRQERRIFERNSTEEWDFGPTGNKFKKIALADQVGKDSLLLSVANFLNIDIAKSICDTISKITPFDALPFDVCIEDSISSYLPLIKFFDTGLSNIYFDEKVKTRRTIDVKGLLDEDINMKENEGLKEFLKKLIEKHDKEKRFAYIDVTGKEILMPEYLQSSGTLQLLNLCNSLVAAYKRGAILVCDEIEENLHPMACQALLKLLHALPGKRIQLICTTHNVQILNDEVFRRDQIWITEKNIYGNSTLYSIADFKGVRNNARLGKQYLEGRFGGLPVFNPAFLDEFIEHIKNLDEDV